MKKKDKIIIGAKIYFCDFPEETHTVDYIDNYGFTTDLCFVLIPWNELRFWKLK